MWVPVLQRSCLPTLLHYPHNLQRYRLCGKLAIMTGNAAIVDPEVQIAESIGICSGSESVNPDRTWREVKIPVPWGHVSGKWWGPSVGQPVLALHGWQDNAGTFDRLIPLLPHDLPVFAIDLPGHGLSSHYPKGQFYYLSWDGALLVRRIVKHFNWESMTLLGHSLGGIIGFMYAAIFPDAVKKLIQIDIAHPTIRQPGDLPKLSASAIDRFLKYEDLTEKDQPSYDYEEMLDIVVDAYNGSVSRESCKILLKRGMMAKRSGDGHLFVRDIRLKVAGLGFPSLEQVLELAGNIQCRVLNIRALPHNTFDKREYYNQVLDQVRVNAQVEYHEVEGTHHLHLNTPERISSIVTKFLQS